MIVAIWVAHHKIFDRIAGTNPIDNSEYRTKRNRKASSTTRKANAITQAVVNTNRGRSPELCTKKSLVRPPRTVSLGESFDPHPGPIRVLLLLAVACFVFTLQGLRHGQEAVLTRLDSLMMVLFAAPKLVR